MSKLYPPQIEGTVAAFYDNTLIIPFVMNQIVSKSEISKMAIKIKSILNNEVLFTDYTDTIDYDNNKVAMVFDDTSFLSIGQFYKVQIAYVDQNNEVGYYSTVGITKYTTKPEITILQNEEPGKLYCVQQSYTGKYSQETGDSTEKVYSYEFAVYDKNNELYLTSGQLLHNHENDTAGYESTDSWELTKSLKEDEVYTLYYKVITSNGLEVSSKPCKIYTGETVDPVIEVKVVAEVDNNNGIAEIALKRLGNKSALNGSFILSRANSKDKYNSWEQLQTFRYSGKPIADFSYVDYTLEHGIGYQYSLQQVNFNTGLVSNRIYSNTIEADFDDIFLFDGERQLRVQYNPKVTSFKQSVLEQKQTSIGGKYPYFYKNGQVSYKEFPISGLVSYLADENEKFLTNEELYLDDFSSFERTSTLNPNIHANDFDYFQSLGDLGLAYQLQAQYEARDKVDSEYSIIKNQHGRTTSLEHYNFVAEREFKLKVLEFLNNGKPKLFRSPAEGNYIVQLMSSSMTPDDKLGRMLHTFSTTASEIANYDIINLKKYGFLPSEEERCKIDNIQFGTITMPPEEDQLEYLSLDTGSLWSNNLLPKSALKIECRDMFLGDKIKINGTTEIMIGSTGVYELELDEEITSVQVQYPISPDALIIYSYWGEPVDSFGVYDSIELVDVPCRQIINDKYTSGDEMLEVNLSGFVDDTHTEYETVSKYYRIFLYYNPSTQSDKVVKWQVKINEKSIDLTYKDGLLIKDASFVKTLSLSPGVVANITYQKKVIKAVEGEILDESKLSS